MGKIRLKEFKNILKETRQKYSEIKNEYSTIIVVEKNELIEKTHFDFEDEFLTQTYEINKTYI